LTARRWIVGATLVALLVLGVLLFRQPQAMVAPGPVIPAHAPIAQNCMACHAPFRGAQADRCTSCHKPAEIGLRTTEGLPVSHPAVAGRTRTASGFHQALAEPNCMACHTDHSGPQLVRTPKARFSHDLLRADVRGQCSTCHIAPADTLHRSFSPVGMMAQCSSCHQTKAWTPASFDHARFFPLTGPHDLPCKSCHLTQNLKQHSCTSCHEHEIGRMRALHAEEGIRNIANCVSCHRTGRAEEREGGGERGDED
jgi:hypothetical protein